jgi:catechol 1,2-dioxygenase
MSSSQSTHSPRRLPSFRAVEQSRRDFLSWLGVGTALTVVGCSTNNESDRFAPQSYTGEGEGEEIDVAEQEQTACLPTTRDAKGPYWEAGAPVRPLQIAGAGEPGVRLLVDGRILGPDCRTPLAGYAVDVWQADAEGNYYVAGNSDYRLRGKVKTDAKGRYRFETILPGRYGDSAGIRPAHLHVSFLSPAGNVILTSQLYFEGDPYLGQQDYCTRQGTCNSADRKRHLKLTNAQLGTTVGKRTSFDAVLPRT